MSNFSLLTSDLCGVGEVQDQFCTVIGYQSIETQATPFVEAAVTPEDSFPAVYRRPKVLTSRCECVTVLIRSRWDALQPATAEC